MKCPHCHETDLVMTDRQGIEIDYCPTCRGVWLDRGELDKIIERNNEAGAAPPQSQQPPQPPQSPQPQAAPYAPPPPQAPWGQQGYDQRGYHGHKHHKRRKSFLEELFD